MDKEIIKEISNKLNELNEDQLKLIEQMIDALIEVNNR